MGGVPRMLKNLDPTTTQIYAPVRQELAQVETRLRDLGQGQEQHLDDLLSYLFERGGKGMRPALTLLASKLFGKGSDAAVIMAVAVELLHIATLIHDDTVDNSDLRRGQQTISSRWGRNVAVLLGDYVFATSATFVCDTHNVRVIRRFSETIMELSSGQLMEFFNTRNPDVDRKTYEGRIFRKTASLFQTAAETGAILGGAPENAVQALKQYGYNVGMAFQIVDDILDVKSTAAEMGKPVGNDLLQGVLTLPTLMLLERYPDDNPIPKLFAAPDQRQHLDKALSMIQNSDIIDRCYADAEAYCRRATSDLSALPFSPSRDSLLTLAGYVTTRRK